jgi:4-amino-4-deoxy-L-arabinose transferase-like glycosyltransferase
MWPYVFQLSAGPLYHYLITPMTYIWGSNYDTFKLASVLVSLVGLFAIYIFTRRLINEWFALIATFISGVSSWYLIFSRLGNSQIIVPVLVVIPLIYLLRFTQSGERSNLLAASAIASLGLYVYPQSFIIAPVLGVTLMVLRFTGFRQKIDLQNLAIFGAMTIIIAIPFLVIIQRDSANFFNGYIGGKLTTNDPNAPTLLNNTVRTLLALHVEGDSGIRSNPQRQPHIDLISGILMLVGMVYWLKPKLRNLSPMLFVPFLLLQVPSLFVFTALTDTPNAARTLGVAPIVYIFVASGLWWLIQIGHSKVRQKWLAILGVIGILAIIFSININRYFNLYINGLPYNNTPVARQVTNYIDTLAPNTKVYMIGCCWENSMPEPKGVIYEMHRPQNWGSEIPIAQFTCQSLDQYPVNTVFIWSHKTSIPSPQIEACKARLPSQTYYSLNGLPVFNSAQLRSVP